MKVCKKCRQSKEIECFHKNSGWSDGRYSTCAQCRNQPKRAQDAIYRAEHRGQYIAAKIWWKYGLTLDEIADMRLRQDNQCAVCQEEFIATPCIDHDHKTGIVRGLLCPACNKALGLFRDDPVRLRAAIAYLTP